MLGLLCLRLVHRADLLPTLPLPRPLPKRLIFTGERLDAEAAAAIGLVEAVPGALPDPATSLDTPAFEAALAMAETIAR